MMEPFAPLLMNLWYLFFLGPIRCWAELRFTALFSGKSVKLPLYVFYIAGSCLFAAFFVWIQHPYFGTFFLLGILLFVSIKALKIPFGSAFLSCTILLVLNTFYEGFLDIVMKPIVSTFEIPDMATAIVIQMLISFLLLIGFLLSLFLVIPKFSVQKSRPFPVSFLTLLPCALIAWAVRFFIRPELECYVQTASQAEVALSLLAWMSVAVIAFFAVLAANHKTAGLFVAQQEKLLLERDGRIQAQNAKEAIRRWKDTRAYQHDVKNHLLVLSGLLRQDKTQEAARYLETLVAASDELAPRFSTGSPALDILLEEKIKFAEKENICVSMDFQKSLLTNVDETDVCVLFANALDNAIHACLFAPLSQKHIKIAIKKRHRFLLIQVENGTKSDDSPIIYGTGLQNIRKVALKYGGSMKTEKQDHVFRLTILLCEK